MAEYIEVLHGSVKEGGGVKCIKRGEIPNCTFTLTYCIVGPKTQKARQKTYPYSLHVPQSLRILGAQPAAVIKCVSSSRPRFFPVNLAGALSRYAFWACVASAFKLL